MRALLFAGLEHALVLADRLDHHASLADGVRERLFAVDVLARLAGMDAGQVMPMLRRGVHDDVHVLAIQQRAVVLVGRALVVLRPRVRPAHVQIGHGDDAGVLGRLALASLADGELPVAPSAADDAHTDLVVRSGRLLHRVGTGFRFSPVSSTAGSS